MSNSLNQTLFNKYSDILQLLQIFQVGEYPCVEIHNVVVKKRPVKKLKRKIQNVATKPIFKNQTQTLFYKYSDILQPVQICQVGEYPCVEIHNVVGTKIPVKN